MVAVSYGDMVAEREVAWEAAAAVSPMRRDSRAKSRRYRGVGTREPRDGEALPASCLADFFPVENAGMRAEFRFSQATKRRNNFARGSLSRGFLAPGNQGEPGGV